jgi:hypothetical protein
MPVTEAGVKTIQHRISTLPSRMHLPAFCALAMIGNGK